MHYLKSNKKKLFVLLIVCICVVSFSYLQAFSVIPKKLTLLEGEEYVYNFQSFYFVNIKADNTGALQLNDKEIEANGNYLELMSPLAFKTQKKGTVNLDFKVFGVIPLKTMQVDIIPSKKLVACGNTVGVKINMNGILVIGVSDVESCAGERIAPAKEGGIRIGDIIYEINGKKLEDINDLIKQIDDSKGQKLDLKYKRGNAVMHTLINPIEGINDKKYHIGLWVRNSTAGIGTMTFYDPESNIFGALGHGITDIDTGLLMPVNSGEVLESNIVAIKRGVQGTPGELKGIFMENKLPMGNIFKNDDFGIYGKLFNSNIKIAKNRLYPIGIRGEVKVGPATILSNIEGNTIEEFDVYIEKVARQSFSGPKGMVVKITDKRLLDTTGGIVQGMSGSPIIQNGKLIGAVTHVLVNDPTRGYGIFIEWMIKNIDGNSNISAEELKVG
ncbi:stage IV sporulation protein B [Ruminiclostridium sufflavum DSM 19573]|uniref:Stage IV sporulation protein B n=1 Tax=Ruminiclostridium sufflavum DSM 19573 TaxID=1121337 RepID=A0A318XHY9_9FIRM|nr:SpoIVB peptidase [Ruminiclostridium sufflavum]PYG86830.1 stage IV sporulation protein B [Ruminiclostridium sufflavum DSM 19573]